MARTNRIYASGLRSVIPSIPSSPRLSCLQLRDATCWLPSELASALSASGDSLDVMIVPHDSETFVKAARKCELEPGTVRNFSSLPHAQKRRTELRFKVRSQIKAGSDMRWLTQSPLLRDLQGSGHQTDLNTSSIPNLNTGDIVFLAKRRAVPEVGLSIRAVIGTISSD